MDKFNTILKAKFCSKSDEEMLLTYISSLILISKQFLTIQLRTEDLLLHCLCKKVCIDISVLNNSFYPLRDNNTILSNLMNLQTIFLKSLKVENYFKILMNLLESQLK